MLRGVVVQKGKKGRYGYTFGYTFLRRGRTWTGTKKNQRSNRGCPAWPVMPVRGVAQATRAGEPRQRPLLNLTGGHFSAITHGHTSHYLPQGMSGPSRFMISENNGSKCLGEGWTRFKAREEKRAHRGIER